MDWSFVGVRASPQMPACHSFSAAAQHNLQYGKQRSTATHYAGHSKMSTPIICERQLMLTARCQTGRFVPHRVYHSSEATLTQQPPHNPHSAVIRLPQAAFFWPHQVCKQTDLKVIAALKGRWEHRYAYHYDSTMCARLLTRGSVFVSAQRNSARRYFPT